MICRSLTYLSLALLLPCTACFATVVQIPLNYNFNGIVHEGEAGQPDAVDGYRSIADRGLVYSGLVGPLFAPYSLVDSALELDLVHLGNRNTVAGGSRMFENVVGGANGDNGIQPNWLADVDQTGPQTTVLANPVLVANNSEASFLYQISNGGGNFDVRFSFDSGPDFVATLSGPDWFSFDSNGGFGGIEGYQATEATDRAAASPDVVGLKVTEGIVDLSGEAGRLLTSISFENRSNTDAGYGILAANVSVPEPSSALLVGLCGFLSLGVRRI